MQKNILKTGISIAIAVSVWLCSLPETVMAHGTTDQTITKDMLVTTPDKDYQVNMEMQRDASEGAYNAFFLDNALQTVSIDIDETNLNYLFQHAKDKPTVMTNNVTIGGEQIGYTGLKTKGNYALKHSYDDDDENDRFSFTIKLPTVFGWEKKLNQLNEGKDFSDQKIDINSDEYITLLNTVMDVDEAISYFAVHSFLVQLDDMFVNQQNYGLYIDKNGKSTLLPWDYDLCFGCYFPGTTELTANFAVEEMYWEGVGTEAELVRPQPAYFTSYIDKMQDELKEAASEKLTSNVRYHMRGSQPYDMLRALPNLSKIMAQRSMGGYNQVMGIPYFVAGNGCELYTLGNAMPSWYSNFGYLMLADDKTGISVSSYYGEMTDKDKKAPLLSVKELGKADKNYQAAKQAIGCGNDENLTVYQLKASGDAKTKYIVRIPLDGIYDTNKIAVYSYTAEKTTKLNLAMEENVCTGKTASVKYIAVLKTVGEEHLKEVELEDDSIDLLPAAPENPPEQKEKKKVSLNKTSLTLKKGKTFQLKIKNAVKKVIWKTTNKKVAAVGKKGKVTAKKKGNAVIKAIYNGKTFRCKVKVK